jgi:zinc protease
MMRFLMALAALMAGLLQPTWAQDPLLKSAVALYDRVQTHQLENGLRVALVPMPGAATVTTILIYKVGSADELLDQTGLSHYLEHLMFKGTDKLMPGDIDRATLKNGGANNAFTSEDVTAYHFDFAADRWEKALEIEADRIRNLRIDSKHEFEQEKGAVIEELKRNEDEPWDLEYKAILPLIFTPKGPYGHSVIGEASHVRAAQAKGILAHHARWYHPNNALLVIAGGIDPADALAKAKKHLGKIPAAKLPPRMELPAEKPQLPARKTMPSKFEVARVLIGYPTVARNHPDEPALDLASSILADGKSSRLYQRLVEKEEIASGASATNDTGRYPGWLGVQVELVAGANLARAEKIIDEEIEKLLESPVGQAELDRVRRQLLAQSIYSRDTVHGLAQSVAMSLVLGDGDGIAQAKAYLEGISQVTPAQVQAAAKKYLGLNNRAKVVSIPTGGDGAGGGAGKPSKPGRSNVPKRSLDQGAATAGNPLAGARRVELPSGAVVWLLERRDLPVVNLSARWREARLYEPNNKAGLAQLTGGLLEEGISKGDLKMDGKAFAEELEAMGAQVGISAAGASLRVLTPQSKRSLELVLAALEFPSFPKDAFERNKKMQVSEILESEKQSLLRAREALARIVYGAGHPMGRRSAGTRETVEKLSREDVQDFHAKVFTPGNLVMTLVGDFDSREMEQTLRSLTKDWPAKPAPALPTLSSPIPTGGQTVSEVISMPETVQLQFLLGHQGIRRDDPDYYALLVMDHVLGTGPGFTDRLSSSLRDREGLAYTVSAQISGSADLRPGIFLCYIGTDPANFARVEKRFREEIARIRTEEAKPEEVDDAKSYLIGSLAFKYDGGAALAERLQAVERFNLGLDHLTAFKAEVNKVNPARVKAVAEKHLHPDRLNRVAAGPIDEQGKVLKKVENDK